MDHNTGRTCEQIRSDVEELFLEWNNFLKTHQLIKQLDLPLFDEQEAGESLARAFLSVIEATSTTTTITTATTTTTTTTTNTAITAGSQFIPSLLVERMVKFIQVISVQDDEAGLTQDLSWRNHEAFTEFRCWYVQYPGAILTPHVLNLCCGGETGFCCL